MGLNHCLADGNSNQPGCGFGAGFGTCHFAILFDGVNAKMYAFS